MQGMDTTRRKGLFGMRGRQVALGVLLLLVHIVLAILLLTPSERTTNAMYAAVLTELETVSVNFAAFSNFFLELAETNGAVHAFEVLKRAEIPPNIDVHLLGHVIGDELYRQQGIEGMKHCTHDFRNACSHTVVIGALLEHGMQVFDEVHDVCRQAPGGSGAYTMCFHGFGHGVLAYTEYEPQAAVALCKRVGTAEHSNREYYECAGGVTMEMTSGIHDPVVWEKKKAVYMPADDPLALCRNDYYPDEVKSVCYVYITPMLFAAAGADLGNPNPDTFADAFAMCDTIPKDRSSDRAACFGGFGKEFTVLAQNRDVRDMSSMQTEQLRTVATWCGMTDDSAGRQACLGQALASLYWGGENDPEVSIRFCDLLPNSTDVAQCFTNLFHSVAQYVADPVYRAAICARVPESFVSECNDIL